jgi:hypothetical protein
MFPQTASPSTFSTFDESDQFSRYSPPDHLITISNNNKLEANLPPLIPIAAEDAPPCRANNSGDQEFLVDQSPEGPELLSSPELCSSEGEGSDEGSFVLDSGSTLLPIPFRRSTSEVGTKKGFCSLDLFDGGYPQDLGNDVSPSLAFDVGGVDDAIDGKENLHVDEWFGSMMKTSAGDREDKLRDPVFINDRRYGSPATPPSCFSLLHKGHQTEGGSWTSSEPEWNLPKLQQKSSSDFEEDDNPLLFNGFQRTSSMSDSPEEAESELPATFPREMEEMEDDSPAARKHNEPVVKPEKISPPEKPRRGRPPKHLKNAVQPKPKLAPNAPKDPNHPDNQIVTGIYTRAERREKIRLFREKKKRRDFSKKIAYTCRKTFADNRPRVGGRFVPMENAKSHKANEAKKKKKLMLQARLSKTQIQLFNARKITVTVTPDSPTF